MPPVEEKRRPESHCPVCYSPLEVRDVAPCHECGGDPRELEDLAAGRHRYADLLVFGRPLTLCDFCQVDFSSYDPAYFGRPPQAPLGPREFQFVRDLRDARPGKDKFCPACNRRLAFLRWLAAVRRDAADAPVV